MALGLMFNVAPHRGAPREPFTPTADQDFGIQTLTVIKPTVKSWETHASKSSLNLDISPW